ATTVAEEAETPLDETLGGDQGDLPLAPEGEAATGKVAVNVDSITCAGALVSVSATMSDGKKVDWYLDQYGRLGMVPPEPGYRPPQSDLMEFQAAVVKEVLT